MRDCMCKPGNFWNDDDVAPYGVKLMGGHQFREDGAIVRSPGHNCAIETEDGWFLIHHTRFAPRDDRYIVQTRSMRFNDFGWPVVAPTRYAANLSEGEADLTGAFKVLFHGQNTNAVEHIAVDAEFHGDGTVSGGVSGSFEAGETLILNLDGVEYRGVYCNGYDSDQDAFVTNFTAMSQDGQTVWGVWTAGQD